MSMEGIHTGREAAAGPDRDPVAAGAQAELQIDRYLASRGPGAAIILRPDPVTDRKPNGYAIGAVNIPAVKDRDEAITPRQAPDAGKTPDGYAPRAVDDGTGTGPETHGMAKAAPEAAGEPETREASAPDTEPCTGTLRLGGGLRFGDGRLWAGDGDAFGRTVYGITGDRLVRATDLDVGRLRPFYETVLEEASRLDRGPDIDHVYAASPARLAGMAAGEGGLPTDTEATALSAIKYGNGLTAAPARPWGNCLRLLEYAGTDRDTGAIKFSAPFFSGLAAASRLTDSDAADEPAKEREDGTATGRQVVETPLGRVRRLTPAKLNRISPHRFQFIQTADDGTVMFAWPVPSPYGDGLTCGATEDGQWTMTEEEFRRAGEAWEEYALTLPECRRRTEAGAGELTELVDDIALITDKLYRHALVPIQNGTAFIMPAAVADALGIRNGASETNALTFSLEKCDPNEVDKLDFAMLATVYSIILHQLDQSMRTAMHPEGRS